MGQELLQAGVDDEVTLAVAKNNLAAERMQAASTGPQQKKALADSLKHLDSLMAKVSFVTSISAAHSVAFLGWCRLSRSCDCWMVSKGGGRG